MEPSISSPSLQWLLQTQYLNRPLHPHNHFTWNLCPLSSMATHPTRPQEQDDLQDIDEAIPSNGCGGCFRLFGFGFGFNRNGNYEGRSLLQQQEGWEEESWMVRKLKKLKDVSEMVGGPRWKNFIRKMGGFFKRKKQRKNRFQYDPESYALNFDDGFDGEDDDHHPPIAFSTRFSIPLASSDC